MIYASAPGKLNLFFEVGPIRPDGYHSVISIYQALAIRQLVGVEPHSKWEVITKGDLPQQQLDLVPKDENNLCVIAAKALAEFAGIAKPQPMRFLTHKQVPVAAGLAGGSADAAASLVALNQAWGLGLTSVQLQQVASKVGSDVPFSLLGGTALGLDTGIELEPLEDLPTLQVVLLISPIGLSTKAVFLMFDQMFPEGDITELSKVANETIRAGMNVGKNSLLRPALALRPELADYQSLIGETTGHLSGSGPTIYFVTEDAKQSSDWANHLSDIGHLVIQTTTSNRGATLE